MIFKNNAKKYFDMGYFPFPTRGSIEKHDINKKLKAPITENRNGEYDFNKVCNDANNESNIGIGVGKQYGVIALDIDTPEVYQGSEVEKAIESILPTSDFLRVGRPGRKLYFFKYKNEDIAVSKKDKNGQNWVELLTNGKFVIVPPSIHPCGNRYAWIDKNIISCKPDELPEIDIDIYKALDEVQKILDKEIIYIPKDKRINIESNGRNNLLVKFTAGKFNDGKDFDTIIQELIEYDELNHNPPLFKDPKENNGSSDSLSNATRFVSSVFISLKKKHGFTYKKETKLNIIDNKAKKEDRDYKRIKLPEFRGLAQELFKHIYNNSPVPRTRFAVASTLACFSTILSNRVKCRNTYTNMYLVITTPSGGGKDYPLSFPYQLFNGCDCKDLIGGAPESDSGILFNLEKQPSRLDVYDEASRLFILMGDQKNAYASKMADVYAQLYSAPGKYYPGKTLKSGVIGACYSPCLSLFCALTIDDFKKHFNIELVTKGIGARFLFFPDNEHKDLLEVENTELGESLIKFVPMIRGLISKKKVNFSAAPDIIDLKIESDNYKRFIAIVNEFRREGTKEDREIMGPIYNRLGENMMKLAIIDSISSERTSVTKDSLDWSYSWIKAYINSLDIFLSQNLFGTRQGQIGQLLQDYIQQGGKEGRSKSDLIRSAPVRKFGLHSKDLKVYLDTILEAEYVFLKDKRLIHSDFVQKQ